MEDFVRETNTQSVVYNMYVCPRDTCLEGPIEEPKRITGPEDIGPGPQHWM